jgi:hypothetical protein
LKRWIGKRYEMWGSQGNKDLMCVKVIVEEGAIVRNCRRMGVMYNIGIMDSLMISWYGGDRVSVEGEGSRKEEDKEWEGRKKKKRSSRGRQKKVEQEKTKQIKFSAE